MTVILEWLRNPPDRGQLSAQGIIDRTPEEKKADGETVLLQIDASVREAHAATAMNTENPIEDGAVVSDHSITRPDTLRIDGVISNTPFRGFVDGLLSAGERSSTRNLRQVIPNAAGVLSAGTPLVVAKVFDNAADRDKRAYDAILALRTNGTAIRVITSLRDYTNMVIDSFVVNRTRTTHNSLAFTLALKQIRTVDSLTVPADKRRPPKKPSPVTDEDRVKQTTGQGTKAGEQASDAAEEAKGGDSMILGFAKSAGVLN